MGPAINHKAATLDASVMVHYDLIHPVPLEIASMHVPWRSLLADVDLH